MVRKFLAVVSVVILLAACSQKESEGQLCPNVQRRATPVRTILSKLPNVGERIRGRIRDRIVDRLRDRLRPNPCLPMMSTIETHWEEVQTETIWQPVETKTRRSWLGVPCRNCQPALPAPPTPNSSRVYGGSYPQKIAMQNCPDGL